MGLFLGFNVLNVWAPAILPAGGCMNTLHCTFHICRQPAFSTLNRFRSRWTDLDKSSNFHGLYLFRPVNNQVTVCYFEFEIIVDCSFHLRILLAAVCPVSTVCSHMQQPASPSSSPLAQIKCYHTASTCPLPSLGQQPVNVSFKRRSTSPVNWSNVPCNTIHTVNILKGTCKFNILTVNISIQDVNILMDSRYLYLDG